MPTVGEGPCSAAHAAEIGRHNKSFRQPVSGVRYTILFRRAAWFPACSAVKVNETRLRQRRRGVALCRPDAARLKRHAVLFVDVGITLRSAYWCGANRRRTPACAASRRSSPRVAVADQPRPPVAPARMQNTGPIGNWIRCSVQRATWSHAQSSIPTVLRFPPFPTRTSTDPVFGSKSDSVRASASLNPQPGTPQNRDQRTHPVRIPARGRPGASQA